MTHIAITISGVTPLICNKFTDASAAQASAGTRSAVYTTDRGTPLEIAESKLYLDLEEKVCIPSPNVLRCIVDGGAFFKAGRSKITTQKSSLLYSCLDIEAATIPIVHRQPWKVDSRAVRIPSTGGRILCHRPMFDDWKLEFEVDLDIEILSTKLLRQIIDDSGKRIGLGDFRPSTKGPYGKFVVDKWAEEEKRPMKALKKAA